MVRLLAIFATVCLLCPAARGQSCDDCAPVVDARPSWMFAPGTYTHDPATGARVAQYNRVAPVEGLDDPRAVTSSYRRTRTSLRGADGSVDASYQVQSWGNGNGGIDAEWERFHDAWRQSNLIGSFFNQNSAVPYGYGNGFGQPWGSPHGFAPSFGQGYPYGHAPQYGIPPYGPTPQHGPHFRQRFPEMNQ